MQGRALTIDEAENRKINRIARDLAVKVKGAIDPIHNDDDGVQKIKNKNDGPDYTNTKASLEFRTLMHSYQNWTAGRSIN